MIDGDITGLISTLGFPVFVALWFMLRTEKIISGNTKALIQISEIVKRCPAR